MKYYDPKNKRLVFEEKKADEKFWDSLWKDDQLKSFVKAGKRDQFVSFFSKKFLKPDRSVRILEGGCGKGQYVYALNVRGYNAIGIDYAPEIVKKLNALFPKLPIQNGDVRNMQFNDESFDGYWSLGVIEHFYEGYDSIIREAFRVLKPGGFLFLTFPYMSPFRKIKAYFGKYRDIQQGFHKESFYQFALNRDKVIEDLQAYGFDIRYKKSLDGMKGLKDEVDTPVLKNIFSKIYYGKGFLITGIKMLLYVVSSPIFGHITLIVAQKKNRSV